MKRFNPKLAAQPDHSHYFICMSRKTAIEDNALQLLKYTLGMCLFMIMLSLFTVRFALISWIPSLIGESTEVGPLLLQISILLGIAGLSALNCGRFKICGVILQGLYIFLTIAAFFSLNSNWFDILTLILGIGGIFMSFRMVTDYLDWNQLKETEGFPIFNLRYTEHKEHSEYRVQHTGENASDHMADPTQAQPGSFTGLDNMPQMPGLAIGESPKAFTASASDPRDFIPFGGKHCKMSESPIKTS